MLTKKVFCDTIEFMKQRTSSIEELNKLFSKEFEDSCFYPYFKWEAQMRKVLSDSMCDRGDWVNYYCWELDFGEKWEPGTVTEKDGTDIPMKTSEELYNFLLKEYQSNH